MKHVLHFQTFLSNDQIISDSRKKHYGIDRTGYYEPNPLCVLLPKTSHEVSLILRYCNEEGVQVVPSAGRTGLSGAAVAKNEEVVLSVEKMNMISDLDIIGGTIEVGAGAILEDIHKRVDEAGLYFPVDFAAKGSCMVGGFISTNAGGVKVLKYGMTRQYVLGLEVVLATGEVLDLNKSLLKDNSGYDLKQMFIGAEGTLGIITKATFKCVPRPVNKELCLIALSKFSHVPTVLELLKKENFDVLAFEYLDSFSVNATLEAMPQLGFPFEEITEHTVLLELDLNNRDFLEAFLEKMLDLEIILDASIADNSSSFNEFWSLRESASDSIYLKGVVHANDVSVPINRLTQFLDDLEKMLQKKYSKFEVGIFGHIGDGNLHIYIVNTNESTHDINKMKELDRNMFVLVQKYDGSISAEHGIGLLKKDALTFRRSNLEITLMRSLKKSFDPNGILNPGKIF